MGEKINAEKINAVPSVMHGSTLTWCIKKSILQRVTVAINGFNGKVLQSV